MGQLRGSRCISKLRLTEILYEPHSTIAQLHMSPIVNPEENRFHQVDNRGDAGEYAHRIGLALRLCIRPVQMRAAD